MGHKKFEVTRRYIKNDISKNDISKMKDVFISEGAQATTSLLEV